MRNSFEGNHLVVGIGDIKIGKSPDQIVTTLGSCISVCLYASTQKVGGMLHFMMPSSNIVTKQESFKKAKYADTGVEELLENLKDKYGVYPNQLKAKLFGGASVLMGVNSNIGKDNFDAAKSALDVHKILVETAQTGGEKGYRISFSLETGTVMCQCFGEDVKEY